MTVIRLKKFSKNGHFWYESSDITTGQYLNDM